MDNPQPAAEMPDESGNPSPNEPIEIEETADAAVLLSDEDFLPEPPRKPPGPGIPESLGWIFGLIVLQVVGAVFGFVLAIGGKIADGDPNEMLRRLQDPAEQQQFVETLLTDSTVALFCGVQSVFLLGAVAAAMLRLGRNRRQFLPLKTIPVPHGIVIGLLIVSLLAFVNTLAMYAMKCWEWFLSFVPQLEVLSEAGSMDVVAGMVSQTSLPLLLLLIAFVPAVAEELVFRGVIGRGLVARWGLPAGVMITSVLFAVVHVHPVQAFALMPLAICIHLSYIATRSFWAPMAIHFANNAVAVIVAKFLIDDPSMVDQAAEPEPSLLIFLSAGLCVVSLTALMWQMRVQYFLRDGTLWDPGYAGADVPSAELAAEKRYAWPDRWLLMATAVSGMLLIAAAAYVGLSSLADSV